MLQPYSIKDLYLLALTEGEGMGTAYEYFAKRLVLDRWLAVRPLPRSVLVAGLPERYGVSLDFFLLASELGAHVTVVDERPEALSHLDEAMRRLVTLSPRLSIKPPDLVMQVDFASLTLPQDHYDLVLSSEVIQRLPIQIRKKYVGELRRKADAVALFTPNADNDAHTTISGLSGLPLTELRSLITSSQVGDSTAFHTSIDYIDMPPFPPGITRSAAQREQAKQGWGEAVAMWGLGLYARLERLFPGNLRRSRSHIVYALLPA